MSPTSRLFAGVFSARYGMSIVRWSHALLLVAISFAPLATAQQYETDKDFDPKAGRVDIRTAVQRMVKDPGQYTAGKAQFAEFFSKYYLPAMTRPAPEDLAELGKLRYELFQKYLWVTTNPALQADLTELARAKMQSYIANPVYHPAARYNAILVMGMLDAQYSVDGRTPPTPLPQATKVLTFVVDKGAAGDARFPPLLVLGALIGLERHAQYRDKLDQNSAQAMSTALMKLVNQDAPIQEMDSEAYAWLRLRAASALAQLRSVGPNGEAHAAILKLIADGKSLDDRTAAASLLNKITYKEAKIDGESTVKGILQLAADLADAEGKRARDFEESAVGFPGRVSAAPEFADPNSTAQRFPSRQVLARLSGLRRGLLAVKPALAEEEQARLDEINKAIEPAIKATANAELSDLAITGIIRTMASAIERIAPPPSEPADAAPEAEAPKTEPATPDAPPAEAAPADAPPAEAAPTTEAPPAEPPAAPASQP